MTTTRQIVFDEGAALRDAGMKAATDRADRENPTWSDRALAFVHHYALTHAELTIEDVRTFAHNNGLPMHDEGRAWGSIPRVAAGLRWIQKTDRVRLAADPKVHKNRCTVWTSLIYNGRSA
jgi:hypothetical protein